MDASPLMRLFRPFLLWNGTGIDDKRCQNGTDAMDKMVPKCCDAENPDACCRTASGKGLILKDLILCNALLGFFTSNEKLGHRS